ncbi:MAG: hypothetical protein JXA20_18160, partial [Spirochaetes bacterium]|nr:hypothetical protein [Spirochaetota bacterium]
HHAVAPVHSGDGTFTVKNSSSAVLAYISENTNAIGYVSAAYLNPEVKPLKLDGLAVTDGDTLSLKYHLKRPLFLYVNDGRFAGATKLFVIYLLFDERGKSLLRESGFFYNSLAERYHP